MGFLRNTCVDAGSNTYTTALRVVECVEEGAKCMEVDLAHIVPLVKSGDVDLQSGSVLSLRQ